MLRAERHSTSWEKPLDCKYKKRRERRSEDRHVKVRGKKVFGGHANVLSFSNNDVLKDPGKFLH